MVKTDKTFFWKGDYFSLQKIYGGEIGFNDTGGFSVRGFTTPPPDPRGTLTTGAPISDSQYRKAHKTKAGYHRVSSNRLDIFCDWGRLHYVDGDASLIDGLVAEMQANGIPEQKPEEQVKPAYGGLRGIQRGH